MQAGRTFGPSLTAVNQVVCGVVLPEVVKEGQENLEKLVFVPAN